MKKLHIECLPDECLVKTLGQPRKLIEHHNDKGRVCNFLQKNGSLTALIDEDPGSAQPSYLSMLTEISKLHNVRHLEDKKSKNRAIILCPKLEDWIIEVCRKNDTRIESFGLAGNPNALHREITGKIKSFHRLLLHLLGDKRVPQILHLKDLLAQ